MDLCFFLESTVGCWGGGGGWGARLRDHAGCRELPSSRFVASSVVCQHVERQRERRAWRKRVWKNEMMGLNDKMSWTLSDRETAGGDDQYQINKLVEYRLAFSVLASLPCDCAALSKVCSGLSMYLYLSHSDVIKFKMHTRRGLWEFCMKLQIQCEHVRFVFRLQPPLLNHWGFFFTDKNNTCRSFDVPWGFFYSANRGENYEIYGAGVKIISESTHKWEKQLLQLSVSMIQNSSSFRGDFVLLFMLVPLCYYKGNNDMMFFA